MQHRLTYADRYADDRIDELWLADHSASNVLGMPRNTIH